MTNEEYKQLSIKEFMKQLKDMKAIHAGLYYEM